MKPLRLWLVVVLMVPANVALAQIYPVATKARADAGDPVAQNTLGTYFVETMGLPFSGVTWEQARSEELRNQNSPIPPTWREDAREIMKLQAMGPARKAEAEARILEYRKSLSEGTEQDVMARWNASSARDALSAAMGKAKAAESANRWIEAQKAYADALRLDSGATGAADGIERCRKEIEATITYEVLIDEAQFRLEHGLFQQGIAVFNSALQARPPYIPVDERVAKLGADFKIQNRPVNVILKSDGLTSVTIVGVFVGAKFTERIVALLPNTYSVTGSRQGYQNERLALAVRADDEPKTITIAARNYLADKFARRDKEAVRWFSFSANQGYPPAQNNLGVMYANGRGVSKDLVAAWAWFSIAAGNGNADGNNNLSDIEKRLSSRQKANATTLARELTAKIEADRSKT